MLERDCEQCGKTYTQVNGTDVNRIVVRGEVVLRFCSEKCANEYYLEYLNSFDTTYH